MKLNPPKGTRDFLPEEMNQRQYVLEKIRKVYEKYGFGPMQTPVFESWEVLKAKSGEEAKNQIYYFKDKSKRELGMRFDLTVGTARAIAANPDIPKPIKRYNIGKAWRYEEISKGRYREFVQADIDIIGEQSVLADAECVACAVEALQDLGFRKFTVRVNNRKILNALLKSLKLEKKSGKILRAIDKLDKIGVDGVSSELKKAKLKPTEIKKILDFMENGTDIPEAEGGKQEIKELKKKLKELSVKAKIKLDYSLVRGLAYYSGNIFEIESKSYKKSIAGGGRYDNLIGIYGEELPAVGVSLGFERIMDIIQEKNLIELPKTITTCYVFGIGNVEKNVLNTVQELRDANISVNYDLSDKSISKNLEYADSLGYPFVIIIGERELKSGKLTLKNMESGKEQKLPIKKIIKELK